MRILMVTHQLPTPDEAGRMAPTARQIDSLRAVGIQVDTVELSGSNKLKYLPTLSKLHQRVLEADLIHAHFGYCGWLARTQFRKPVVLSFMGDDLLGTPDEQGHIKPLSQAVVHLNCWVARHVDAVIVKSKEMAQVIAPFPAYVVPNGVDLCLFQPLPLSEARSKLGWPMPGYRVLFPGNPEDPGKGFRLAQEVVALATASTNAEIELVPLWDIPSGQVPLYMNACNAMLMTSFSEGSPNVVKEAMACNLPIATVPVGDVAEMLQGVQNCFICAYDAEMLAAALQEILHLQQQSNGRERLKQRGLDLPGVAHRIINIYAAVLQDSKGRSSWNTSLYHK